VIYKSNAVVPQAGHRAGSDPEPDYRFTLANERTFLAWVRTALGLFAAAVALENYNRGHTLTVVQHVSAALLALLAACTVSTGLHRYHEVDRAIRCHMRLPGYRPLAALGVAVGVIGLAATAMAIANARLG
jgi:putative membrane protein